MMEQYINYYRLLFAILNSDDEDVKGVENQVIVYDEDNLPVGVFKNIKRCANFFELTVDHIYRSIREDLHIKKRYRVEKV